MIDALLAEYIWVETPATYRQEKAVRQCAGRLFRISRPGARYYAA